MGKKLLLNNDHIPGINTYDVYRKNGGYASVEKAIKTMTPEAIVEEVKNQDCVEEVEQDFPQE